MNGFAIFAIARSAMQNLIISPVTEKSAPSADGISRSQQRSEYYGYYRGYLVDYYGHDGAYIQS
jgi:hypothetical protein